MKIYQIKTRRLNNSQYNVSYWRADFLRSLWDIINEKKKELNEVNKEIKDQEDQWTFEEIKRID